VSHYAELLRHKGVRGAPHIKLYVDLLSEDWLRYELSDDAKAALPYLWLLTSKLGNRIPLDHEDLARRLPFSWSPDRTGKVMEELCAKKIFRRAEEFPEPAEGELFATPERDTTVSLGGAAGSILVVELDAAGAQKTVPVHSDFVDSVRDLYPALDLVRELRRAREWLINNPSRRKTAKGMRRFLIGWFDRQQNRPVSRWAE